MHGQIKQLRADEYRVLNYTHMLEGHEGYEDLEDSLGLDDIGATFVDGDEYDAEESPSLLSGTLEEDSNSGSFSTFSKGSLRRINTEQLLKQAQGKINNMICVMLRSFYEISRTPSVTQSKTMLSQ